jgi:Spy/CpxP family protein refolding chaperone
MFKWIFILAAVPALVCAQMPRGMWWEGKVANDLNLTETQHKQIRQTIRDFRSRMVDQRTSVDKAEKDLEAVFNEDPVDQKKANDAIDRLAGARAELFKVTSQMDLKFRSILTAEQWKDLKTRMPQHGGPGGPGGRPNGKGGPPWPRDKGTTTTTPNQIPQK